MAAVASVCNAGADLSHKRVSPWLSGHLLALESLETMRVSWPSVVFPLIGKYMLEYLHCFPVALS